MGALDGENVGMTADLVESNIGFMFGQSAELYRISSIVQAAIANAHNVDDAVADVLMTAGTAGVYGVNKAVAVQIAQNISSDLTTAAENLSRLATELRAQVDAQRAASSDGDGYADPGMSKAAAEKIFRKAMVDEGALGDMSPAEVRAWWRALSAGQRREFLEKRHWVAGNTNGIPFGDRMVANRLNAEDYLRRHPDLERTDPEQHRYLSRVTDEFTDANGDGLDDDGRVRLISFDPGQDRIIEVVGDLNPNTTNIVNYVPGTAATMGGFYGGDTQKLATDIVAGHPERVAFVWKDGKFPPDLQPGDTDWVGNNSWAAQAGTSYTDFNLALGFENPRSISVMSIEHSYGSSIGGYAESAGIHFDSRVALGGAGMTEKWVADPDTTYISITGPVDFIHAVRGHFMEDRDLGYATPPDSAHGWREVDSGHSNQYGIDAPVAQHRDLPDTSLSRNVLPTIEEELERQARRGAA